MRSHGVANAFDELIERVGDPNSMESWSEHHTVRSLRKLRATVVAEMDAMEIQMHRRAIPSEKRIELEPGERWG